MSDFIKALVALEPARKAREEYDRYLVDLMCRHLDETIRLGKPTPETQAKVDRANAIATVLMKDDDDE